MGEEQSGFRWNDTAGATVKVGDTIRMMGVPFAVKVLALVECEEGCTHGAAAVKDPVTGLDDEVCLAQFYVAGPGGISAD